MVLGDLSSFALLARKAASCTMLFAGKEAFSRFLSARGPQGGGAAGNLGADGRFSAKRGTFCSCLLCRLGPRSLEALCRRGPLDVSASRRRNCFARSFEFRGIPRRPPTDSGAFWITHPYLRPHRTVNVAFPFPTWFPWPSTAGMGRTAAFTVCFVETAPRSPLRLK